MKNSFLFLSLLIFSTNSYAAWYKVEMVMFEHLIPDTGGEQWLSNQGMPDITNSVDLAPSGLEKTGYQIVDSSWHQLGGVYNVLKNSREYRPFFHIAWQQPGLGQSRSKNVHIKYPYQSGEDLEINLLPPELEGLVRLRVGHLLHIDIDLAYFLDVGNPGIKTESSIDLSPGTSQVNYVRLKESRRLKLNELHYFDHPLFGAIVRVSRLESE